ncbi:MAG: hypothetical protein PHX60_15370 [Giesbergeria sp.]|uniref:hypothetical protein n=1 Tax=Giesbergeria sp. TaxID=2818473 RepID=UPI002608F435|nr:hypothetical protein [Giesbergeria sp.]MDD2611032.1 hypothetical protein [Giesbergeria sp.]
MIADAQLSVCYAAPGVQLPVAHTLAAAVSTLGPEMVTVCLDFDERVMRMGYGDLAAVELLRQVGVVVRSAPGMRTALVIVDGAGFSFTPTPLYLEPEPAPNAAPNAMRMSAAQVAEALARLSPAAKAIAIAQAPTLEEKRRIEALPDDVGSKEIANTGFNEVAASLKDAPPVRFDLARQVRVFEPYLQYVELSLTGASIQRHRLAIPKAIQELGGSRELEGRLRTTFELIEKGGKLSSKKLEDTLNEIRKNFTPSLGKDHGRVVLKAAKPHLVKRLDELGQKLKEHQAAVAAELQEHLDASRQQIVDYYLPTVKANPPDSLRGGLLAENPSDEDAKVWLETELNRVLPTAESMIQEMKLEARYKDVTFETLNEEGFLESVKAAFPRVNWDKAYKNFKAAGESLKSSDKKKD